MTQVVTQGATPVRWGADKHVTKLTGVTGQLVLQYGLCEPVYGSITPLPIANILTRLVHLNYFFGFVLADFTLNTWYLKKMFTYFCIFLYKRVHILYKVPIRSV